VLREGARRPRSSAITEVHIVGGHNPDLPYEFYTALLSRHPRASPRDPHQGVHLRRVRLLRAPLQEAVETIFEDFKAPGSTRCRAAAPRSSPSACAARSTQEADGARVARRREARHRAGLRSNATMLYGHIETIEERIEHLGQAPQAQDETGGFMCFIPLAFHPENTEMQRLPGPTGSTTC
jgi:aminodeoxyfutalosine synthase